MTSFFSSQKHRSTISNIWRYYR